MSTISARLGRVLLYSVVAFLVFDGAIQLLRPPFLLEALAQTGFAAEAAPRLAMVTLACAMILAIPRTAIFGAILTTGFLGGAIAVHFRIGEIGSPPQLFCLLLGIATWGGLYLGDGRLRALLPLRIGATGDPATDVAIARRIETAG